MRVKPQFVVVLAILGLACDRQASESKSEAAPASAPATAPAEPPKAAPSPLAQARSEVTRHMPQHFAIAHDLAAATIDGDVESAKKHATALLAESPSSMPADWFPHVERLRTAARGVTEARDLAGVAASVGGVAGACGQCHAALGQGPSASAVPMPETASSDCMLGHRWATERLWLGVVADDDDAWQAGVAAFADRPACPKPGGEPLTDPDVFETMRKQLKQEAAAAATARDLETRAQVYGKLLGTCGTCHVSGC